MTPRSEPERGEVVRSLPGMGPILTVGFPAGTGDASRFISADRLASGDVSYQHGERRCRWVLRRVFYRSAFSAISCHEPSQAYHRRKRSEGKIALARRRVDVLWAMLRDGAVYEGRTSRRLEKGVGMHRA